MTQLEDEITANFVRFTDDWTKNHSRIIDTLKGNEIYLQSYKRIVALQALKTYIITPHYRPDSAAFYYEAHNDALISHVSAASGAWRSSLKALRSCIENILCCIYYQEHPVEYELWSKNRFIIGFSELIKYMEKHPGLSDLDSSATGLQTIKSEYETLSRAVHASAANFRMTDDVQSIMLWSESSIKASQWATRQRKTIEGVVMLIIAKHRCLLEGAKLVPAREVLGLALTPSNKSALKQIKINIS